MAILPSPARRLTVPRRDATPRGFVPAPLTLRWPDHNPSAILDYSIDIRSLLAIDDSIAAFSAAVTPSRPGGLVVDSVSTDGAIATVWLGDGVDGVEYKVNLSIGSFNGRYLSFKVSVLVTLLSTL